MHALNFLQDSRQVNQSVGIDKLVRREMLVVRECRQLAYAWIRGIVVAKNDRTAPTMIVSIKIFFNRDAFTLDEFLEIRYGPIPEFDGAREKGDITSFSIDGERIRKDEGMR